MGPQKSAWRGPKSFFYVNRFTIFTGREDREGLNPSLAPSIFDPFTYTLLYLEWTD